MPVNMASSESYKFLESLDNISNTFRFKIMLKKSGKAYPNGDIFKIQGMFTFLLLQKLPQNSRSK